MSDMQELQAKLAEAMANNDVKAIEEIAGEIVKGKAERRKVEVEAQRKEAEALAGDREKLAGKVHKAIKALGLDADLAGMKAHGFTYKLDEPDKDNVMTTYKAVGLTVAVVKERKAGAGGGAGKTKDEYGMGLQEVYDKFHTADDEAKMLEAEVKDKAASDKLGKITNSNQWRVKNDVKKRALADGLLAPTK